MEKLRSFCVLVALVILLVWVSLVSAGSYSVTVTWDYPNPPTDLAGFCIYVGDEQSANVTDETARGWAGVLALSDCANIMTMTAYDLAGQESERSDPFAYDPVPSVPGLTTIVVR